MSGIQQANRQWMSRPYDQRFTSLQELHDYCVTTRERSHAKTISSRGITAQPVDGDHKGLMVVGPNGGPVNLTHWSFGQLAQRAGAPAGYMRDLPAPLAADCLNYGLLTREIEDLGVLLYKNGGPAEMRAVTGPNYGRIWNSTLTGAILDRIGDGLTGDWRVPGEFGKALTEVTKRNTTLYASDRDMFVFLADEVNRIEIPNRRNGLPGSLARGIYWWNSEVGGGTVGMASFLFDYACENRTIWGGTQYQELRIRHTASAPDRWIEEAIPAIEAYRTSSVASLEHALQAAQTKKLDDVDTFLANRFSRGQVAAIKAAHMADEQRPIETLWDAVTGVTAYARGIQFQNERVAIEREAGRILDMVA